MIELYRQLLNELHKDNIKLKSYQSFLKMYDRFGNLEDVISFYKGNIPRKNQSQLLTEEKIKEAYKLRLEGYKLRELSEKYHVSKSYFDKYFKELGLKK